MTGRTPTIEDYIEMGVDPEIAARTAPSQPSTDNPAPEYDGAAYIAGILADGRRRGRALAAALYIGASRCADLTPDVRSHWLGKGMAILEEMPDLRPGWLERNAEKFRVKLVSFHIEAKRHELPGDPEVAPNQWPASYLRMLRPFVENAIQEIADEHQQRVARAERHRALAERRLAQRRRSKELL